MCTTILGHQWKLTHLSTQAAQKVPDLRAHHAAADREPLSHLCHPSERQTSCRRAMLPEQMIYWQLSTDPSLFSNFPAQQQFQSTSHISKQPWPSTLNSRKPHGKAMRQHVTNMEVKSVRPGFPSGMLHSTQVTSLPWASHEDRYSPSEPLEFNGVIIFWRELILRTFMFNPKQPLINREPLQRRCPLQDEDNWWQMTPHFLKCFVTFLHIGKV